MHLKLPRPRHATIVAYVALFFAMSGTAYAATGGTLILGGSNAASRTTSLTDTGSGPALRLATKSKSTPPLAVSNGTEIPNLNAAMVDGVRASSLQPRLPSRLSFTPLTMQNGWFGDCYGRGVPGIALAPGGVVYLHGTMCNDTNNNNNNPFTIPVALRPAHNLSVPVDFGQGAVGQLEILTDGSVWIDADPAEQNAPYDPPSFTSLAGVTYTLPY